MRAPFLSFAAVLFIIFSVNVNAERPFSFKETPGKLPKEVIPTNYSIRVVPSIDKLAFTGTETVKLNVRGPVHQLILNALELEMQSRPIRKRNCSRSHCRQSFRREITLSRSVFPEKSTSKGRGFFTCAIRNTEAERKKSCSEHNLKRPMPADSSRVGMNQYFVRGFN